MIIIIWSFFIICLSFLPVFIYLFSLDLSPHKFLLVHHIKPRHRELKSIVS